MAHVSKGMSVRHVIKLERIKRPVIQILGARKKKKKTIKHTNKETYSDRAYSDQNMPKLRTKRQWWEQTTIRYHSGTRSH